MSFISKAINFRSKRNLAYLADTLQIRYLAFIVAQRLMDTNLHLKKSERLLVSETSAIVNSHIKKYAQIRLLQRGWTTWLMGGIDDRIIALAPVVLSCVNLAEVSTPTTCHILFL